jgi:hypothetical protein
MPVYSLIVFGGFVNRAIQRFSLTENSATICKVLHQTLSSQESKGNIKI